MKIDAGLDTGDMLLKAETEIGPDETAIELGARMAGMGADLLVETLDGLRQGTIVPEKQDSAQASYAPLLKKEDGVIDWSLAAEAIHNRVRGLQPWPGAYTRFREHTLHIWKSRPAAGSGAPGTILGTRPLSIGCGEGVLEAVEVQIEGRRRMPAADFVNGQHVGENEPLGEDIR
jgi:methionyl-tRNA formyltransferase